MDTASMDKELLSIALKKCWKDSSVAKVLSVDLSPAVGKFQNYLSTVTRVKLRVVLGNGRTTTRSVIVKKTETDDESSKRFQQEFGVFRVETMMYQSVLREMEYLMEEFEDTEGILWGTLLHYVPYSCMVFEDLKAYGFSMADQATFFDLEQSLLAAHCLGRYHAMLKVVEERGVITRSDCKPWFVFQNHGAHKFWNYITRAILKGVKAQWGPKWESIVDGITLQEGTIIEKLQKAGEVDESKFNIFNHGDCHKNNIMIRHDERGRPIELRFLDFQIPHYGSPCCDLTYLMYLAVDCRVRRENYDQLLEVYHRSLTRSLERFQYSGKIPDLQEIRDGMDKMHFLGIFLFSIGFPSITVEDVGSYFDFEKINETEGEEGVSMDLFKLKSYQDLISPELEILLTDYLK